MFVAHTAIALIHRSGPWYHHFATKQWHTRELRIHSTLEVVGALLSISTCAHGKITVAESIADISRSLFGLKLRSIWERVASGTHVARCLRGRKYTPVQLVSFSLMAPYRVGENDDGRGNFDRAFSRRNWNCAWIIMNAPSSEPSRDQRDRKRARAESKYIYIFFIAPALPDQFSREWLYPHRSYARGTWRDRKNKYLQSAWNKYFIYFVSAFSFLSRLQAKERTLIFENREL